ncbi:hypothetical protein FRB90_005204 [Tulasnella sp. 427]|nr:hypothetical protein FRB90_005204 [Tulasnella sp. 427]
MMERQFTNITFEKIESLDRDPYHWELAHAFLNASEWGCMTIREIADEVYNRFPAKYNNDEDAQQACLVSYANLLWIF